MSAKQGTTKHAAGEYLYYEHEGAKFRRRPTTNYTSVDDVLFGSNWEPYTGDTLNITVAFYI